MRADGDLQLRLEPAPAPPEPPAWIKAVLEWLADLFAPVGRFLRWIGGFMPEAPFARILLWSVLAIGAALIVWIVIDRVRSGGWRWPTRRFRAVEPAPEQESWAPELLQTRAWLEEADALAAAGRYGEAAHHLLHRSIEDLARRRPQLNRPALTARELAAADAVPPPARALFAGIAGAVERSLFGGRSLGVEDWEGARAAYADFALPRAWRA